MDTKTCTSCGETKPLTDFHRDRTKKTNGTHPRCKTCRCQYQTNYYHDNRDARLKWQKAHYQENKEEIRAYKRKYTRQNPDKIRESQLRVKYGMTLEDYNTRLALQGGVCAICQEKPRATLHVDHCHASGRVRGLLCGHCNRGLGGFRDRSNLLMAAVEYLGYVIQGRDGNTLFAYSVGIPGGGGGKFSTDEITDQPVEEAS